MEYRVWGKGRLLGLCCPKSFFAAAGCEGCGETVYRHHGDLPRAFVDAGLIPAKEAAQREAKMVDSAAHSAEALAELRANYASLSSKARQWQAERAALATEVNSLRDELSAAEADRDELRATVAKLRAALGREADTVDAIIADAEPSTLVDAVNAIRAKVDEDPLKGRWAAKKAAEYAAGLEPGVLRDALAEVA